MVTAQDDDKAKLIKTINDSIKAESILAEKDARNAETVTNYTLKVPIGNVFLQAGLIATTKYIDKERQTMKTNDDTPTNYGSMANHVAREWMILCGKPETHKLFDETTRGHINDILEHTTAPLDSQPIFLVAQTRMLKNGEHGIICIRMASKHRQLEAQMVRGMRTN